MWSHLCVSIYRFSSQGQIHLYVHGHQVNAYSQRVSHMFVSLFSPIFPSSMLQNAHILQWLTMFMLPWARLGLEENKSSKVLPAQLMETDKYDHSPALAVFHFWVCSNLWRLSEDSNSCLCQQKPLASAEIGCETAATLNCRCYCSIKRSLSKCLVRFGRLEEWDIHVEYTPPPQSLFV